MYMIDHADASVADLIQFVKGPDFPTAAFINGRWHSTAYETGRGKIWIRSCTLRKTKAAKKPSSFQSCLIK